VRVLVTGAFGFVGAAVARRLAGDGHEVVALTSRPAEVAGRPGFAAEVRRADLRDPTAVLDAVAGCAAVCHLAGMTAVRDSFGRGDEYAAVNVAGTTTLVGAFVAAAEGLGEPGRFVFASSAAVYGAPAAQPIRETTSLEPTSPYGVSKAAAEGAVAAAVAAAGERLGAVTLRIFNAAGAAGGVGDPSRTRIIPNALRVAAGQAESLSVNGDGSVVRDYVHVADVADAFALALDGCAAGRHAVYNVGATTASVLQILDAARAVTGRPIPVSWQPARDEPPLLAADWARINAELGWRPSRSGLRRMIVDAWRAARLIAEPVAD
jgi:UDP-glucose 4-epimerase